MISAFLRTILCAALLCLVTAWAHAQTTGPATQDTGDYLPPARLIAKQPAATLPAPQGAAQTAAPKTVGLISVVGDSFMVRHMGTSVPGNALHEVPIAAWKVDDRVSAKVAAVLVKTFKVKRIPVPAGTFQKYETAMKGADRRERQRKLVADFAAAHKCDYYLLVSPSDSNIGSTDQGVGGLGLLRGQQVLGAAEYVFALSELTVYDTQLNRVRSAPGSIGESGFMSTLSGPHLELTGAEQLPKDAKAAVSDPRARQLALELLDKSLDMTLPRLFATN